MSKEMDDLIVSAHSMMDTEDAALSVMNNLHDLFVQSQGDPAKAAALAAELDAKKAVIAAAIANDDPSAPPPVAPPADTTGGAAATA